MADVTLSSAVRNNLLALQDTAGLLAKTQERLATGLKVNSALDDPTAFFTASSLNSRAGDLNRVLDTLSNGIQTIQAADDGLTAITNTVEALQATVNQARQDASFQSTSFTLDSATIGTSTAKTLDFSAGSVGSTPVSIALNSTATTAATQSTVTASADYVAPTAATAGTNGITFASSATAFANNAATAGTNTFAYAADATAFGASDTSTFEVNVDGGGATVVTINQAAVNAVGNNDSVIDSIAEFTAVLNAAFTTAGINTSVVASDNGTNVTLTSQSSGTGSSVVITNATPNADGGAATNTLYGLVNGTGTDGLAAVDDSITFDVAVDGGSATTVTVDRTTVQSVGNNDDVIDSIAEFTAALNAAFTTAGINTSVVASDDGSTVTLTSQTTGTSSAVVISSSTADADGRGNSNPLFGISDGSGSSGAAAADRVITIGNGTSTANITLTSANAGDAATARSYITSQLTAQSVSDVTVGGTGNRIDLAGATDGSNTIAIGGANVNDVFGAGAAVQSGITGSGDGAVQTVDELVTAINANSSLTDKVRASNDNGSLRLENLSLESLTLTGATSSSVDGGTGTAAVGGNTVRQDLVNQFNTLRNELNKLADDASYNGVNLLSGDLLKLNFNETGTSNISIQAKDSSGNVRAINAANLGVGSATDTEFGSNTSLDTRRDGLTDALNTLRTQASQFGSNLSIVQNREDFTKDLINTLETGAANLTLADTNEEGANLLALQTRQSLASTALSLASQADQNVLRLF